MEPKISMLPVKNKTLSPNCNNCGRLTEIEGEMVCLEKGKITRLILDKSPKSLISLYCGSWYRK